MPAPTTTHRTGRTVRTLASAGLAVAVLAATPLVAAPAHADTGSWTDPHGDVPRRGLDLHRVTVRNHADRLVVRLDTSNLTKRGGGGTEVWIDTRPHRRGPEYAMTGGIGTATDFYIWRTKGWDLTGDMPLPCELHMSVDYRHDKVRWATGDECLGDHGKVRVSVAAGRADVIDQSPAEHRFHPWVARD